MGRYSIEDIGDKIVELTDLVYQLGQKPIQTTRILAQIDSAEARISVLKARQAVHDNRCRPKAPTEEQMLRDAASKKALAAALRILKKRQK